jgi:hypothetical protein
MSGGLSRHGHHLLEARTIDIRQILPLDGVIDHGRHARNTIGERRVGRIVVMIMQHRTAHAPRPDILCGMAQQGSVEARA